MGYFAVAGVLGVAKGKNLSILFLRWFWTGYDAPPRRRCTLSPSTHRSVRLTCSSHRSFPFFLPSFPPSWRDNGNWQKIDSTWLHFGGRITPVNASLILIYLFRSRLCRVFPFSRRDLEEKEGINALPPLWSKKKINETKYAELFFFFFFFADFHFREIDLRKRFEKEKSKSRSRCEIFGGHKARWWGEKKEKKKKKNCFAKQVQANRQFRGLKWWRKRERVYSRIACT